MKWNLKLFYILLTDYHDWLFLLSLKIIVIDYVISMVFLCCVQQSSINFSIKNLDSNRWSLSARVFAHTMVWLVLNQSANCLPLGVTPYQSLFPGWDNEKCCHSLCSEKKVGSHRYRYITPSSADRAKELLWDFHGK
jgi:hypothetical protein